MARALAKKKAKVAQTAREKVLASANGTEMDVELAKVREMELVVETELAMARALVQVTMMTTTR